jgi:hypothetical protein
MVMSWLINSMTNKIGENFLLYETIKEIWEAVRETYSTIWDWGSVTWSTPRRTFYYSILQHSLPSLAAPRYVWNSQLELPWRHSPYRIVEQKRTFKFLLGLNKNLDEVRGRIMRTKPFPNLREAFSEVRCEESR